MSHRPFIARSVQHGLTLIEALCVLAITAVLFGSAVPAIAEMRQAQLLRATLQTVETDVNYARTVAVSTDRTVRLSVQAYPGGGSCTVVHTGAAHDCRCSGKGQAVCQGGAQLLRLSEQPGDTGVSITLPERSLAFDAGRGTVSPTATLVVTDGQGRAVHQIINIVGRTRLCTKSGLANYPVCP